MHCDDYAPLIGELMDGSAGPDTAAAARAHLDTCPACRALAEDVTRLRAAARTLEAPPLPAHLWPRIADALQREEGATRHGHAGPAAVRAFEDGARKRQWNVRSAALSWLPAAAALLLVTGGLSWVGTRLAPGAGPAAVADWVDGLDGEDAADAEGVEELQLAEAAFADAIAGLEAAARAEAPTLEPAAAGDWLDDVADLDAAIDESREATRMDPNSLQAREHLLDALRTKMVLLQDTMALMDDGRPDGAGNLTPGASPDRELLQ